MAGQGPNALLDRAKVHFDAARRLDRPAAGREQLGRAKQEYERGLQALFLFRHGLPPDDARHEGIRSLIKDEMARAERVQQRIRGRAAGGAAAGPRARPPGPRHELAKQVDPRLWESIESGIVDVGDGATFDDVAGLADAKQALREMVILPVQRPDLFDDPLRRPPRGLLLYGPPGNGKTMVANAVASEARAVFLPVSASSLVSKNMGDGEKLVRALFLVARARQPSVVFIDEIDSILSRRREDEHEASRRLKTEFMVQFNALTDAKNRDRVVVIGATNLPDQLDDAVLRRLSRHVYVGPPDGGARRELFDKLLGDRTKLTEAQLRRLVRLTEGYSSSDLLMVCKDAAMGPLRDAGYERLAASPDTPVGPMRFAHFEEALANVPPTVPADRLARYEAYHKAHNPQAGRSRADRPQRRAAARPRASLCAQQQQ